MTLSLIDSDPTEVARVPHGAGITRATCVAEARAHLRLTGEAAGVVYSQGRPVGIVTAAALDRATAEGRCDSPVAAMMDFVAVGVDPTATAGATLHTFTRTAWDWLSTRPG